MNKKYVFIILLIFSNLLFSQEKIKVAVLPFSSVNEEEGDTISSIFANELSKRKVYTVLTRNSQMEKAMKELNFQRKGMTDENTIAEIGKALNAQYVMAGSISKLGRNNTLVVSMINVETLENLTGSSKTFRNIEDVIQYVPQIVNEITGTKGDLKYSEVVTDSKKSRRVIAGSGSQEAIDRILMKREGQKAIKEIKSLITRGLNTGLGSVIYDKIEISRGATALMLAAYYKYNDLLEALIAAGADINLGNIDALIAAGENVNPIASETALSYAIYSGNIEGAAILIDSGIELNRKIYSSSESYLNLAASKNEFEILKLLVEAGMDVNVSDSYGCTPLIYSMRNYEMFKYLLEHKADPNLITRDNTSFEKYKISPIVSLGNSWNSVIDNKVELLKLLLEYGADPDMRGGWKGSTILIYIVSANSINKTSVDAVKLLLQAGADPNVENNDRKTALQFLESRSYTNEYSYEIIKILLEAGAR